MLFEFDPNKSAANKRKHGIDFRQAKALWEDPDAIEVPVVKTSEPRWLVTGMIEDKCWTAVVTLRGEVVRLISVRRARKEEERLYEENQIIRF